MRKKRPDIKNADSLLEASRRTMGFTLKLEVSEESADTIIRNVHEAFRMLGEALLLKRGRFAVDHTQPIEALIGTNVQTGRPLSVLTAVRKTRNSINYYGYRPSVAEAKDAVSIAEACFEELAEHVSNL